MSNISTTALLGVAAVLGPVILAVLAQSEDRALATKQCAGETCITASTGKAASKKLLKTRRAKKPGESQKTVNDKSKSVQAMVSVRPNRISCGDGRAIVAKRFNRVRVVECKGRIYTYLGRRNGATFRVTVDRGTGRLIRRAPI